jgi:hypothetical protein
MAGGDGTDVHGRPFRAEIIEAVWNKGRPISGIDPDDWRRDLCGVPIQRSKYGDISSKHGWQVDHIKPPGKGGTDDLANLQPLQWGLNRYKGDDYPWQYPPAGEQDALEIHLLYVRAKAPVRVKAVQWGIKR